MQDWKSYVEKLGRIHNICEDEQSKLLDSLIKSKHIGVHSLLDEEYLLDGVILTDISYDDCLCHAIVTRDDRELFLYTWEFRDDLKFEVKILKSLYSHLIDDLYEDEPLEDFYLGMLPL